MGELDGKVAVITGAGSGMGKASAHIFVREGAQVVVSDVSGAEKDTAAELGDAACRSVATSASKPTSRR